MIHLAWGFSLLFSSTLVFFYFKKDNRVTAKYLCLFGALIGAILGILNIFVQKYDGYCSICIGVLEYYVYSLPIMIIKNTQFRR